jgi:hypothetical protein
LIFKIPLIFHFNQHLVEFARLAGRVCYRGLLRTLLDAPVRANIHISGTLVQALRWVDPEPLELIEAGLKSGQFELLGSTHAQNILIATDGWDNARQIEHHREILEETFSVRPSAFWNPERCWRQELVSVLADAGYNVVTVEDHILDRSGAPDRVVYETGLDGRSLRVVRDDERFKHLFNYAAWFGRPERVHEYLDWVGSGGDGREIVFAYAEDAEAMGLWGYSVNVVPEQTWDRLGRLLDALAGRGDVETVLFRDLPDPVETIDRIAEGSAAWMDTSLQAPDRPYHEDGYRNWFHFIETSPKLARAERMYAQVRGALQDARLEEPLPALALQTFLTHQYEYGCIGIGGRELRVWSGAIAAVSLLKMAAAEPGTHVADWNGDGLEEILVREGDQVVVLSAAGGRLLYWADLKDQVLIVGNPSSVVPGRFVNEATAPPPLVYPWEDPPDDFDYTHHLAPVAPPTPMRKFLPDWIWDPDGEPLDLALATDRSGPETRTTLTAQQGAFLDEIILEGVDAPVDLFFTREGLAFTAWVRPGLALTKTFSITASGPSVRYRFTGPSDRPLALRVTAEIAGDYAANLREGRMALTHVSEPGTEGVRTSSGRTIRMTASAPDGTFTHRESFHALTVDYNCIIDQTAEGEVGFLLELKRD